MRPRQLGGLLLAVGAALALIGLGAIAEDLWPDGEISAASLLLDLLLFVVPGLVLMGIGAKVGRARERRTR